MPACNPSRCMVYQIGLCYNCYFCPFCEFLVKYYDAHFPQQTTEVVSISITGHLLLDWNRCLALHKLGNPIKPYLRTRNDSKSPVPCSWQLSEPPYTHSPSPPYCQHSNPCPSGQLLTIPGHKPSLWLTDHHPLPTVNKTSPP